MAQLVSSWSNGVQSVPKDYVMPPARRPGDFVPICKEIPVIDLQKGHETDRSDLIQQLLKACQDFGLFQVINHGVSETLMEDIRILYSEFFNMSVEDKLAVYSEDFKKPCMLFAGGMNYATEEVHFWKDTLRHGCHPLEEHMPSWPEKPARYRDEVGRYAMEVRKMGFKVLDLIGEGLGLNKGYFNSVSQDQAMVINHYPPCPDPSLTMGLGSHNDHNVITFLQQDQYGLQMLKDGKWLGIEPIPNAFVVNLGWQLEVISNGMLKSIEHRAVTNSMTSRTTIGTFFGPNPTLSVVIEPAKELITSNSPQMFKPYQYTDFRVHFLAYLRTPSSRNGTPLDPYRL